MLANQPNQADRIDFGHPVYYFSGLPKALSKIHPNNLGQSSRSTKKRENVL